MSNRCVAVVVDGERLTIDVETTGTGLKQMIQASDTDVLTFRDEHGDLYSIPDGEPVLKHVSPGQEITSQPDPGRIWGSSS